ncbi:MAG: iron-sulfur cluster assembly scaffold protein [Planctomycetaceae bacterium]|nr:iron-sulfur cluster assembly scaffold protein [Planctomycetaceae bacterium]
MSTDQYEELYEDYILPHFEDPYHKEEIECASCQHSERNPLCGDTVTLQLIIGKDDIIEKAFFSGNGCAISQAGASILCEEIEGKTVTELEKFSAEEMLELLKVPLTATRQRCGLLGFKVLKTMLYSRDGERIEEESTPSP